MRREITVRFSKKESFGRFVLHAAAEVKSRRRETADRSRGQTPFHPLRRGNKTRFQRSVVTSALLTIGLLMVLSRDSLMRPLTKLRRPYRFLVNCEFWCVASFLAAWNLPRGRQVYQVDRKSQDSMARDKTKVQERHWRLRLRENTICKLVDLRLQQSIRPLYVSLASFSYGKRVRSRCKIECLRAGYVEIYSILFRC